MNPQEFKDFHLSKEIELGLADAGFKIPSPVQQEAIPLVLAKHDLVAQAHTGTGKTAAFGLPIMSMMSAGETRHKEKTKGTIETLVITPTRELAMQISDELYKLGKYAKIKTATVYGGQSYSRQIKQVEQASILVATPGRLLDLLTSKKIKLDIQYLVLDEADEMLNMGFIEDIKNILQFVPPQAQKLLFSATMPNAIKNIAEEFLHEPKYVQVTSNQSTNKDISQEYYIIEEREREQAVMRLIDFYDPQKAIIFCRMKKETDALAHLLLSKGYSAKALNGDMDQREREATIKAFKSGAVEILVATDIAARGLDIADTSHVFNYHLPFDSQSYVHRIGRTGRAGKKGKAITLISPHEYKSLHRIKKNVGTIIEHKFVPSMQDVTNDLNKKLVAKIAEQKILQQAMDLSFVLEEKMELSQVVYKLLSIILEEQKISGPDKIGLDEKNVQKIMERFKNTKNEKNKKKGSNFSKSSHKSFKKTRSRKTNTKSDNRGNAQKNKAGKEKVSAKKRNNAKVGF